MGKVDVVRGGGKGAGCRVGVGGTGCVVCERTALLLLLKTIFLMYWLVPEWWS